MENRSIRRHFCVKSCMLLLYAASCKTLSAQSKDNSEPLLIKDEVSHPGESTPIQLSLSLPTTLTSLDALRSPAANYFVSEKLDGVRAYWDGSKLFFRSGRPIYCPQWFTEGFPDFPIDGELWMGRGKFEELSAAVRRRIAVDYEWKQIKYCLFELPNGIGNFEQRLQTLRSLPERLKISWLTVMNQTKFETKEKIYNYFSSLMASGAEGIVLHLADAEYIDKRTDKILKFKPYFDAEALVLKHLSGSGKFAGLMGALLVQDRDGKQFRLGSGFDQELRKNPPPVGSWLTFRFRDVTEKGIPRFATYLRPYEPD